MTDINNSMQNGGAVLSAFKLSGFPQVWSLFTCSVCISVWWICKKEGQKEQSSDTKKSSLYLSHHCGLGKVQIDVLNSDRCHTLTGLNITLCLCLSEWAIFQALHDSRVTAPDHYILLNLCLFCRIGNMQPVLKVMLHVPSYLHRSNYQDVIGNR